MTFTIRNPLKVKHEELHAELIRATQAGGQGGCKSSHEHFVKEEEFAAFADGLLSA
jgi:hypothetical protein